MATACNPLRVPALAAEKDNSHARKEAAAPSGCSGLWPVCLLRERNCFSGHYALIPRYGAL
eukprot:11186299-Lingulodinium_polyedra.AAC.1